MPRFERWLMKNQALVLAVIVIASVLLRIGYFLELNRGPCVYQHRWDQTDMNFFHIWAQDIAAGDWLTNKPLHPYHYWQQMFAKEYFHQFPEAAAGAGPPSPIDPGKALFNRWYGGKVFQQEPLYPYLVALTYKVFWPDVRWVFVWQMLLGVGSNLLVYLIARRYFGVIVAAVAGLLAVLCGPMLFYEMILLRESLILFTGLGLVYLTEITLARRTWRWWLLLGLACGLAVLLKTTFLAFFFGALGLLVYRHRVSLRALLGAMAALTGGLVLCLLPLIARNVAVGVPPWSLQSVAAISFINANVEDFQPEINPGFYVSYKHGPRIMAETGGQLLSAMVAALKTHPNPWSYFKQLQGKWAMVWHWYEVPNNENFYYYSLHSRVLNSLPVTFFLLAPLSLAGLALALGQRLACGPLYLAVACNISILLLFYVLSRYRLPLLPLLIPFAALTIVQITGWLWTRRLVPGVIAIAALFLLSLWTMRPLPENQALIRPSDYSAPYSYYYNPLLVEAIGKADWSRAAAILKDSLSYEPEVVKQMGTLRPAQSANEAQLASLFAQVHNNLGVALAAQGKMDQAIAQYAEALSLKPDYAQAHNNLGLALAEQGKIDDAIIIYQNALKNNPNDTSAQKMLSILKAQRPQN
jgi:tetratricopeptide (TPR) repeat protein